MAFTVEDGTGKSDANSYVSVANADAYFTEQGTPTEWAAASNTEKENALVTATRYIEARYRWVTGEIKSTTQALGWPRLDAEDRYDRTIDSSVIPQQLKDAVCEAAQKVLEGEDLLADTEARVSSEAVGDISVSYDTNHPTTKRYRLIDALLAGLASDPSSSALILRA